MVEYQSSVSRQASFRLSHKRRNGRNFSSTSSRLRGFLPAVVFIFSRRTISPQAGHSLLRLSLFRSLTLQRIQWRAILLGVFLSLFIADGEVRFFFFSAVCSCFFACICCLISWAFIWSGSSSSLDSCSSAFFSSSSSLADSCFAFCIARASASVTFFISAMVWLGYRIEARKIVRLLVGVRLFCCLGIFFAAYSSLLG